MPEVAFRGKRPRINPRAFIASTATLIGDVEVEEDASIWFGVVLRGDSSHIKVGPGTNVQDNAVIHCADGLPTVLGARVTIGHGAILEGCVVGDGALVGMGAVALKWSLIGRSAILAAGSVLVERAEIPAEHLAAGSPAQIKRPLSAADLTELHRIADRYLELARAYR